MSSIVIQVDKLSKRYRLGTIGGKRLVDDVNRWWAKVRGQEDPLSKVGTAKRTETPTRAENGNLKPESKPQVSGLIPPPSPQVSSLIPHPSETLWALRDVSFEVKQGEVLGIIGRNGAGKSTLLKILSRVTAPTSGEVRVKGRIASLLEVGTGFNPELTGRENIFLNGAILGMTKAEIRSKFDEIVAFSEVEQFIDTPVKRYSSGMTVRLAFAVAAHLEPEILIVDEVLAVGDVEFQKKCLGKMKDVAGQGRTVLFVSHNMPAVQKLCESSILLKDGVLAARGTAHEIVDRYLSQIPSSIGGEIDLRNHPSRRRGAVPLLQGVRILDHHGRSSGSVVCGKEVTLEFRMLCQGKAVVPYVGIGFDDINETRVFSITTNLSSKTLPAASGEVRIFCTIPDIPLAPGNYRLSLSAGNFHHRLMDALESAVTLTVSPSDFFGCGEIPDSSLGSVMVRSAWKLEQCS